MFKGDCQTMKRKFLIVMLGITMMIGGCGQKDKGKEILEESENIVLETAGKSEAENLNNVSSQNNNQDEEETTVSSKEKIAITSEVRIINIVEDGTLWVTEKDEYGQECILHTNVYGDVLGKKLYELDGYGYVEGGINDKLIAVRNSYDDEKIQIYDINSLEEISNIYKGDYDDIISLIQMEEKSVLIARKTIETFEEKYECLKIIDNLGNEIFNISLDRNTLLNEYNIELSEYVENIEINYAGNNVYYISYIGDAYVYEKPNSLVIDLNRNKVIPVEFPNKNTLFCTSDGNYTLIYSSQWRPVIVKNETGTFEDFPNGDYVPKGELSEGIFCAGERNVKGFLDIQGNVVVDFTQYSQKVEYAWHFKNGVAPLEFTNGYVTFIDTNGEFLFAPIKGNVMSYFDNENIVVVSEEIESGEEKIKAVDKNGNITEINLYPHWRTIFLTEFEGKKYWVVDGESGLHTQEYVSVSDNN